MLEQACPKCGGSGWLIVEREGISGADRCECQGEDRARRLTEKAAIPQNYLNAWFGTFLDYGHPGLRHVKAMVTKYVEDYPLALDRPGLLLTGGVGTGKTHLAVAALRALIAKGHEGIFCDYQNLLDRIRASYDQSSGASDREAYRSALETDILLLDDLGAHRVTEWVEDIVTSVVTYRCNNQKPLIATTNLPVTTGVRAEARAAGQPGQVDYRISLADRIGVRAHSRLFEMCTLVPMPAVEDHRLRK
jgi:DNA replication protein DnaC